jgi:hypothetical protein
LLIGLVVLALELTNVTHLFHSQKAVSGTIPTISQSSRRDNSSKSPQKTSDVKSPQAAGGTSNDNKVGASASSLAAPYGSFVSNHHPGLNGTPDSEQSLCNTTPGANCIIKFTKGSVVKTLPTQKVGDSGSVSWDWDIEQAGLTSGSWKITAVATLGSQTKQTSDPLALEVQ